MATAASTDTHSELVLVEHGRRLGPDPALCELDDAALEEGVRVGAAQLAALTCRWLELVAEFVVRGVWAGHECRTPSAWLSWAVGIAPSTAREHVRVALRLRECPLVRERFAAGTLSYSKTRAITRVCDPETEPLLLAMADAAPASVLERIVRDTRRLQRVAADDADRDDLGLTRRWRDDGTHEVVLRSDAATGIGIEQHLERLVDLHDTATGTDAAIERPSRRTREAALVVDLLADAVAAGPADTSGTDRHLVVLHTGAAELLAAAPPARGTAAPAAASAEAAPDADRAPPRTAALLARDGRGRVRALSARAMWRMACAAGLQLSVDTDGHPADLGRTRRDPDARLRRLLATRDRSCRFPGCGATRHLHAHHVQWWSLDGPTDLGNLLLLCRFHHATVHERGWTLRTAGKGRWTFHAPDDARPRRWAHPPPGASADALRAVIAAHAHDVDPRALQPPHWDGGGYDHSMTVGLLADRLAASASAAAQTIS